jgi:hypothetical protein
MTGLCGPLTPASVVVILRERSDRRISGTGIQPDRQTLSPEILRPFQGLRMTREWLAAQDDAGKKRCHCEERSDEAIQGKNIINEPWIASPASRHAVSQ